MWEEMPNLNIARLCHSSCVRSHDLYVFAGIKTKGLAINSIERLVKADDPVISNKRWEEIELAHSFLPRLNPVVLPWNDT